MSGVQNITVSEDDSGQRIDRWLRRLFPHVNQGRIEKMCRKGELRLDGGRVKANTRVEAGQTVRVPPLPESDLKPAEPRAVRISDADAKMIRELRDLQRRRGDCPEQTGRACGAGWQRHHQTCGWSGRSVKV